MSLQGTLWSACWCNRQVARRCCWHLGYDIVLATCGAQATHIRTCGYCPCHYTKLHTNAAPIHKVLTGMLRAHSVDSFCMLLRLRSFRPCPWLDHDDVIRVPGNIFWTKPERVPTMRPSSLLSHLAHSLLPLGFRCRS